MSKPATEVQGKRGNPERVPQRRHDLRLQHPSHRKRASINLTEHTAAPQTPAILPLKPCPHRSLPVTANQPQKDCASARSLLAFYGPQNKRVLCGRCAPDQPPPDVNAQIVIAKEKKLVEESPFIYFRIRNRRTSRQNRRSGFRRYPRRLPER